MGVFFRLEVVEDARRNDLYPPRHSCVSETSRALDIATGQRGLVSLLAEWRDKQKFRPTAVLELGTTAQPPSATPGTATPTIARLAISTG